MILTKTDKFEFRKTVLSKTGCHGNVKVEIT